MRVAYLLVGEISVFVGPRIDLGAVHQLNLVVDAADAHIARVSLDVVRPLGHFSQRLERVERHRFDDFLTIDYRLNDFTVVLDDKCKLLNI